MMRRTHKLTRADRERIVELCNQGKSNEEIAVELHITESTVRYHINKEAKNGKTLREDN